MLEGIKALEKSPPHHIEAVTQTAQADNSDRVYLYSKTLLTNEKTLKIKTKQKKRNSLLKARKIKRKRGSYRNPMDRRAQRKRKEIVLSEKVLSARKKI